MAECMTCGKAFCEDEPFTTLTACDGDEYGVCPTCRADLESGRLVRAMPVMQMLAHDDGNWFVTSFVDGNAPNYDGTTPEAALKAAKGENK